MSLVKWTFIGLALLPLAEIVAFILVALAIGWLWALGLFLATSLVGVALLQNTGRKDLDRFTAALSREGLRAVHLETPGLATVIGAILLAFPGFITDLAGILLFLPPVRRWLAAVIAGAVERRRRDPSVVDLAPEEWRQVADPKIEDKHGPERDR